MGERVSNGSAWTAHGGGIHRSPLTRLERAAYRLGWAVDFALAKPRRVRDRLRLEWVLVRNAYRQGFHRLKPGQFGYVDDATREVRRATYAHERAAATGASDRQVA